MIVNKRHSIRLRQLDYSLPNKFFVTICATHHGCYFDKYPELASIVEEQLLGLSKYFKNIDIPIHVLMPNHLHAIIEIKTQVKNVTLGKIINVFKGKTINAWLRKINENHVNSLACIWQRNYYEHRIRNHSEYLKYQKYIELNPVRWPIDRYNPKNLFSKCRGLARRDP